MFLVITRDSGKSRGGKSRDGKSRGGKSYQFSSLSSTSIKILWRSMPNNATKGKASLWGSD